MMGIIVGVNRVEYIHVRKKDIMKHFFTTRNQLYKFYPDCMEKCFLKDKLGVVRSESVLMFPELNYRPYGWQEPNEGEVDLFDWDLLLAEVYEHRRIKESGRFSRLRMAFSTSKSVFREIAPLLPIAIVGIVLLLAFTGVLQ